MIGQTLGPYRIVKLLGEGGFGAVYLGEHQAIGRRVAIKVLLPQVSAHPEMVQRFFNEARVKARVDHPGLVDVFDFGQMADGAAYLVMEFLAGQSLADKIHEAGRVSLPEILTIARQTAAALGAAHGQQVIHRDLKPDNLFLTRDDELAFGIRVKVLDFGIAKLAGDPQSGVRTQTSAIFGTPAYMSPEQCRGAALVDARSDLYSLGCILFEMATGQRPFQGARAAPLGAPRRHTPPRPSQLAPEIAPALEALILKSLEKDPAARQQTMAELIAELDAIGRPSAQLPQVSPSGRFPTQEARTVLAPSSPRTPTPIPTPTPKPIPTPKPVPTPTPPRSGTAVLPPQTNAPQTAVLDPPPGAPRRTPLLVGLGALALAAVGLYGYRASLREPGTPASPPLAPAPAPLAKPSAPPPVAEADPPPAGMVAIAAGHFSMGRADYGKPNRFDVPAHPADAKAFAIERTEVTNGAYRELVEAKQAKPPWPKKGKQLDQFWKLPVVGVSRDEAERYCAWRYPHGGRLPSEVEWERAARGSEDRLYPWGGARKPECIPRPGTLAPAGSVPCGATAEGVLDLSSSVWEWTSSPASVYPGSSMMAPPAESFFVIRGGSYFNGDWDDLTTTVRQFADRPNAYLGFRCVADR